MKISAIFDMLNILLPNTSFYKHKIDYFNFYFHRNPAVYFSDQSGSGDSNCDNPAALLGGNPEFADWATADLVRRAREFYDRSPDDDQSPVVATGQTSRPRPKSWSPAESTCLDNACSKRLLRR